MSGPSGGIDWVTVQRALQRWVVGGTLLPAESVYWGQQDGPRVAEPAVEMRIYTETQLGSPWLEQVAQPLMTPDLAVVSASVPLSTLLVPNHGLVTGDGPLQFVDSLTLPSPLVARKNYWVVAIDPNTVKLCSTYQNTGGNFPGNPITTIVLTSGGVAPWTLVRTSRTRRAGQEIQYVARAVERCTLALECHSREAVGLNMAMAILHRVAARRPLPSQQAILATANIGVQHVERVRAIHGIRNATMFEPRAIMQVHLSIPSEVRENGTIIQRVTGTGNGKPFSAP